MGARITGLGTNRIEICGVKHLRGSRHTVSPDYIETGSYLTAAAVTGGSLTLPAAGSRAWEPVVARGLNKLGLSWHTHRRRIHFDAASDFPQPCSEAAHDIPKIEDGIWPAFPSDLMSVAIVLATQALGTVLFFEKLFESRMYFVDNLISMGARIVVCDPHRIVVSGPAALRGGHMNSPDIRAGMALVTAALCARGESVIENAQVVDRGYEKIDVRLQALGADIVRMA
jgi:UDP-N-acetylglucosamine 1-carboxyvinyltransferase